MIFNFKAKTVPCQLFGVESNGDTNFWESWLAVI